MPEVHFDVRWPDHSESHCYSPSTVIHDYLRSGEAYPLSEFLRLRRAALTLAADRVAQKFGFRCSSAETQLLAIETRGRQFASVDDARGTVTRIR